MYLDEAHTRFILSAKRVGDSFYISQYESFPDSVEDVPDLYYCAVLRTCSEGYFKLFLNGCEACDRKADKYTCGSGDRCDDRQLLVEINHVSLKFSDYGMRFGGRDGVVARAWQDELCALFITFPLRAYSSFLLLSINYCLEPEYNSLPHLSSPSPSSTHCHP